MTADIVEQRRVEASGWFARMQSDMRSDDDLERFNAWLAADPENQSCYARLVSRWEASAPLAAGARERKRSRRRIVAGMALSIAALGGAGFTWQSMQPDYVTIAGEQRRVGDRKSVV